MGIHFNALTGGARLAVEWKARENLSVALASGHPMALGNQKKFLENTCESIASNKEGLRHVVKEYNDALSSSASDD